MSDKFGEYIARVRKENGYKTKTDFANAIGSSTATISRIESGVHRPSPETLKMMADKLHTVTHEDLLTAAGYMDQVEEREEPKRDPQAEELLELLYSVPKDKREEYIDIMKRMIDVTKPHRN